MARVEFRLMITRVVKPDSLMGPLIFVLTLTVFLLSPVRQVTDSRYSMLLTQSLLERGSFRLDHYALPRHEPGLDETFFKQGDYRLEAARGHIYYYLPPGSSVLSAPFVALLNAFGISAVGVDNAYDHRGEVQIETYLAAFLMAALSCIFFYTARLILPTGWSVFVALGGGLGTQVYSTASRALWSHTWGSLLLGIVVFLLLRLESRQRGPSPVLLASLLSWLYFIRPTFAVSIIGVSVYLLPRGLARAVGVRRRAVGLERFYQRERRDPAGDVGVERGASPQRRSGPGACLGLETATVSRGVSADKKWRRRRRRP